MVWRKEDPQGAESLKIKWELVPYTRGRGLDLGCGPRKTFPHFIGVDSCADTQLFGIPIKPDVKVDTCERLWLFADASMDFVFSSHLLEHIKDHRSALKEWWRVIKQGGHLCLYLPHKKLYPNVGEPGANPDHKHDFLPEDIVQVMKGLGGWELLRNEDRNDGQEYSFFQVYKKRSDAKQLYPCNDPKPAKRAAVVRYGAFGDLIQASSVFPGLKEQGFHVTVYTTPRGADVIRHDPHVDALYVQDNDQVENHELGDFWANEAKKYDRWVNLSESVEGTWLTLPDRMADKWPKSVRDKYLNVNYLEFAHDLAQVPLPIRPKFYPTVEERKWAREERKKMGGAELIMYCLAGSSVHKTWPHMDGLLARLLLDRPDCRIATVGDDMAAMLENGWENEPRVIRKAGAYSIRQTMALLDECSMVIGPETGVMNAAAMLPIRKILFLSHSSEENLTKGWVNTSALSPDNTGCFPCHRMHYGWETCNRHESGTALCAWNISLDKAWSVIDISQLKRAA